MLTSKCCSNYICHICINDLQEQERKDSKFKAVCPYGCHHTNGDARINEKLKFELADVDPENKVKKYSDSQQVSNYKEVEVQQHHLIKEPSEEEMKIIDNHQQDLVLEDRDKVDEKEKESSH